jgi:hypothetical protein
MVPFTALLVFFAAALPPLSVVHRASPQSGLLIAASFVALIVLIARQGELEFAPLAAGFLTLVGSGFLSRWLATQVPVSAELIELAIIDTVLLGLLAAGDLIQSRRRARDARDLLNQPKGTS